MRLVSILIPAYNVERWIGMAIESALGQTWKNIEVIVIDDGSTDETFAEAQRWACGRLQVIRQSNQGASRARNVALGVAQGEMMQWLDADDVLARNKVEEQMRVADRSDDDRVLFSSAWGRFFHRIEKARFTPTSLWQDQVSEEWLFRKMNENAWMTNASWLVSRRLTEAAGPWDESLTVDDDGDYFNRVVMASSRIRFVPEARSYYRYSGFGSLSNRIAKSQAKVDSQFESMRRHIATLRAVDDSERARRACINFLQTWLINFYPEHSVVLRKIDSLAAELGGEVRPPELGWKYRLVRSAFGWGAAKRAQTFFPNLKSSLFGRADSVMARLNKKSRGGEANGSRSLAKHASNS